MLVGVSATRAPWSAALRNYVRDHAEGIEVETLLDPRHLRRAGRRRLDVLVIDDMSRLFPASSVGSAIEEGTFVVGLFDQNGGVGRAYLDALGAQLVVPADTGADELVEIFRRIGPSALSEPVTTRPHRVSAPPVGGRRPRRQGVMSVWYSATGGSGLTETMVGVAEMLSGHSRVLLIEAEPLSASMAARLSRSPVSGLSWVLGRVSHGHPALPDGLTGPREDGTPPLGGFDLIGQTSTPGGPPSVPAEALSELIDQALCGYEHVMVGAGPLVSSTASSTRDRFSAGRSLLAGADLAVASATADPLGAVELGGWKATATELGLRAPAWAVLGRAGRPRFEEAQLAALVENSTGARPFSHLWFLPEDDAVARARWNSQLVSHGRWHSAVRRLAGALAAVTPVPAPPPTRRAEAWGLVVAPPAAVGTAAGGRR